MKRKILTNLEAMSGTGWIPEDDLIECPNCGENFDLPDKPTVVCPRCKHKIKIEIGQINLHRVKEEQ
jgi:DNA-directed RNA polymerase subunit RPC12/RpoP